ncbi:NHL repeat-containing protein [Streptomyces sp. NPDC086787]|uniref:NHL repeat-containing protein n=1 Tax=Streptomyces sp. NPDC086787 TaxID=3365759 RepID=UPI0038055487
MVVNERTTIAAAYAMARFTDGDGIAGYEPGLSNAAAVSHNLADITTGAVARVLAAPPNGTLTSTLRTLNSLADLLVGCADGRTCSRLFELARPPDGPRPRNTLAAAADIARAPGGHAAELFALAAREHRYEPSLAAAPDAWILALRYDGNGHELDGPGNLAFDADGNAWVSNNYAFAADPLTPVCGGRQLIRLTPTGEDAPGAPYTGGGLYGAGFGITIDPHGVVWVGNFGFQGSGCPLDPGRFNRSVSQFRPDGRPVSPPTGWRGGEIVQPQGMATDRDGTVWIANCGSNGVTVLPGGRPDSARRIDPPAGALVRPFGVALDAAGRAWVTGNGSDSVQAFEPDGRPGRTITGGGLDLPIGIASDSRGNLWVANSGVLPLLPCTSANTASPTESVFPDPTSGYPGASVTMIRADGTPSRRAFRNGGIFLPWGIAVDGDDTVWVANFGGQRVARLCGARLSACPPGHHVGQPISPPATGYTSDALERVTGIQIDPSGNVWLANNWQTKPAQTNPGGHEIVVLVGAAAPVAAPRIGPPHRPSPPAKLPSR